MAITLEKKNKSLPFLLLTATMVQLVSLTLIYSPANIFFHCAQNNLLKRQIYKCYFSIWKSSMVLCYLDNKVQVYVQGIEYHLGRMVACSLAHSVFDSKISNTHSSPQSLACADPWSSLILLHLTLLCLLLLPRSPHLLKLTALLSLGHVYLPYFSCPLWCAVQALIFPFR